MDTTQSIRGADSAKWRRPSTAPANTAFRVHNPAIQPRPAGAGQVPCRDLEIRSILGVRNAPTELPQTIGLSLRPITKRPYSLGNHAQAWLQVEKGRPSHQKLRLLPLRQIHQPRRQQTKTQRTRYNHRSLPELQRNHNLRTQSLARRNGRPKRPRSGPAPRRHRDQRSLQQQHARKLQHHRISTTQQRRNETILINHSPRPTTSPPSQFSPSATHNPTYATPTSTFIIPTSPHRPSFPMGNRRRNRPPPKSPRSRRARPRQSRTCRKETYKAHARRRRAECAREAEGNRPRNRTAETLIWKRATAKLATVEQPTDASSTRTAELSTAW